MSEKKWQPLPGVDETQDTPFSQAMQRVRDLEALLERERAKARDIAEWLEFTLYVAERLYKTDKPLEPNMAPLFYFTLSYEGDKELIEKTKRAREALDAYRASAKEGEKDE